MDETWYVLKKSPGEESTSGLAGYYAYWDSEITDVAIDGIYGLYNFATDIIKRNHDWGTVELVYDFDYPQESEYEPLTAKEQHELDDYIERNKSAFDAIR
jgi:hypothetical protein